MGRQAPFLDIAERPDLIYRLNFKAFYIELLLLMKEWNLRVSCSLSFYLMSQCHFWNTTVRWGAREKEGSAS